MRFALALAVLVLATTSASGEPRLRFARELPGDSAQRDIAANVLPLTDGALVTGWTARSAGPAQGLVIRLDGDANVLWRRELGGDGADLLFAAQPDSDGFVCAGFTTSQGAGGSDGWLVRLGPAGETAWERTAGGTGDDRLTSLAPTATGWIAAGQSDRGGDVEAWVVRWDRAGNESGQWAWGGPGTQRGLGVVALAEGGCMVTGRSGEGRSEVDGWVTRLSPEGAPVWTHTIGGAGFQVAYHLRAARDGSWLVTGYGFASAARDHDAFVLRIEEDGRPRFHRDLGGKGYDRATQSVELADGSTVTVGYTKRADAADDAPGWQTVLYGLDPGGRLEWTKPIGREGYESGRWIAGDAKHGLWVASQSSPASGGSRVLVARLDVPDVMRVRRTPE